MGDSEESKRRTRSTRGDDERAEVGREHRDSAAELVRRKLGRGHVHGVPVVEPAPDLVERELGGPGEVEAREITEPWALLDRDELTADEQRIVQRSRRSSSDPAKFADIVKLTDRLIKQQLDERSAEKRVADRFLELIKHPPHEATAQLQRDVAAIKLHLAPYLGARRRFRKWLGGGAIGALLAIGAWLYARGRADENAAGRQQQYDQRLERIEHFIFVPSKGPQP